MSETRKVGRPKGTIITFKSSNLKRLEHIRDCIRHFAELAPRVEPISGSLIFLVQQLDEQFKLVYELINSIPDDFKLARVRSKPLAFGDQVILLEADKYFNFLSAVPATNEVRVMADYGDMVHVEFSTGEALPVARKHLVKE